MVLPSAGRVEIPATAHDYLAWRIDIQPDPHGQQQIFGRFFAMADPNRLDPTSMTPAEMAKILKRSGAVNVGETEIAADIENGAPRNEDGTMNLIHYTAWLVKVAQR